MALNSNISSYLLGKVQLAASVLFASFIALVSIIVLSPFLSNIWFDISSYPVTGYTLLFLVVSLMVMGFSKRILYSLTREHGITTLQYAAWDVAEIAVMALLYTVLTVSLLRSGLISLDQSDPWLIFRAAFVYLVLAVGVPYLVAALYLALQDRDNTIRLMSMESVVSDRANNVQDDQIIALSDNEGVLKLSVRLKNLFYIESDDNYIKVWYQDYTGSIKQYMLRCRLKTVEESFANSDLIRCHRKYIINIAKVQVLHKEKDGYHADLGIESIVDVPVSKTYEAAVLGRFNSR